MLERQNLRLHSNLLNKNLHFNKILRLSMLISRSPALCGISPKAPRSHFWFLVFPGKELTLVQQGTPLGIKPLCICIPALTVIRCTNLGTVIFSLDFFIHKAGLITSTSPTSQECYKIQLGISSGI